jgi:hypothetical protein
MQEKELGNAVRRRAAVIPLSLRDFVSLCQNVDVGRRCV